MQTIKKNKTSRDFVLLLNEADVLCHTEVQTRDALILEILNRLDANHQLAHLPAIFEAVCAREAAGATIVANGIAIPHARIADITQPYVAVATSAEGIRFNGGDSTVNLVILVIVPKDQPSVYLQIVSALGKTLQSGDAAEKCAKLTSAKDVVNFFRRDGLVLPDFICAGDIMEPVEHKLLETNSLKDAIDQFVQYQLVELPVVDKEGDLIGIVTTSALLRVCLPDYLLWMDDLSPILQFEPFINVLRHEENTWLSEILDDEYPSIQVGQPAIAVAENLAKRGASTCYIVNGKKLLGVITLPHFLDKILRD